MSREAVMVMERLSERVERNEKRFKYGAEERMARGKEMSLKSPVSNSQAEANQLTWRGPVVSGEGWRQIRIHGRRSGQLHLPPIDVTIGAVPEDDEMNMCMHPTTHTYHMRKQSGHAAQSSSLFL